MGIRVPASYVKPGDMFDGTPVTAAEFVYPLLSTERAFIQIYYGDGCMLRCRPDDTVEVDKREEAA